MQPIGLILENEQTKLGTTGLNGKEAVLASSVCAKMLSIIVEPLRWIATSIENLAWRLVDTSWRAFVVKSHGHFIKGNHENTFQAALVKMDQIFKRNIDSSGDAKAWHLVHENMKTANTQSQLWLQFTKQYGGTCLGNCVALAHNIFKAKRLLTIDELVKIEGTKDFITTAQAVQLAANSAIEYNKEIIKKGLSKFNKVVDQADRLAALGLSLEDYQKSQFQSRITVLINDGIEKSDLGDTTVEQLVSLSPMNFAFKMNYLREKALTRNLITNGLELIKQFELLPRDYLEEVVEIQVTNFQENLQTELFPLGARDHKCVMIINGIPADGNVGGTGHSMLLEIDNKNGVYIFYDNNRGFYQWNDLQSCLSDLESRFKDQKYGSCEVVLSKIVD